MKPKIDGTAFGSISIEKSVFEYDVIINLNGRVKKRKKKLSKAIYGTSHTISLDEAKHVYERGAKLLIIGAGQYSMVNLSEEAEHYFQQKKCDLILEGTSKAIKIWNMTNEKKTIGLFHLTC
jgi:hypothetical protein